MNLCFSIDALSPSGAKAWRLQQDNSWRRCIYAEPLKGGDACITDKAEAESWLNRRMKQNKTDTLVPQQKAGRFDFLMRGIFAHAVLHRMSSAPLPEKAQLIACCTALPPGTPWLIYLDVAGHFRAIDTSSVSILENLDIAVRGEIASAAGYIGPAAAADVERMNALYHQFLAGWVEHLHSSNMNVFVPDSEKLKPEADYIEAISSWQPETTD